MDTFLTIARMLDLVDLILKIHGFPVNHLDLPALARLISNHGVGLLHLVVCRLRKLDCVPGAFLGLPRGIVRAIGLLGKTFLFVFLVFPANSVRKSTASPQLLDPVTDLGKPPNTFTNRVRFGA